MPECLIITNDLNDDEQLSKVAQLVNMTQHLPPRLGIVVGEKKQLDAVRNLPGVVLVCEGSVPDSVLQGLTPAERLFAEAWTKSRQPKTSRPGNGLTWDTGGFQPPDRRKNDSKC